MRHLHFCFILLTICPGLSVAAPPALLEVELRWVEHLLPVQAGAISSAGLPRGAGTLSTNSTPAGVRAAGPVLRVQSGATAVWQLRQVPPMVLARSAVGDGRGTRVELPLTDGPTEWRLEASPTLLRGDQVSLRLSWQQPQDGAQALWQSTLPLRLGRWAVVARSPAPPLPEPGTLRSTDTVRPSQELQVRVSRVLSAQE